MSYASKIEELIAQRDALQALHNELLMAVARKFPGETRHQTALRYIKDRENREVAGPAFDATASPRESVAAAVNAIIRGKT